MHFQRDAEWAASHRFGVAIAHMCAFKFFEANYFPVSIFIPLAVYHLIRYKRHYLNVQVGFYVFHRVKYATKTEGLLGDAWILQPNTTNEK